MTLLFCATEAGGARELIPVIHAASARNIPSRVLSSPVTAPIFREAEIETEEQTLSSIEEAAMLLRAAQPTAVLLGTTGVINNERYLTAAARQLGIRSVVVLDEWYHYALRFWDEDGRLGTYIPDVICVQDALSRDLAIAEGLRAERLSITGDPGLAHMRMQAEAMRGHPPAVPEVFRQAGDRPRVLFLSETIGLACGTREGEHGKHGAFLGFHEGFVRSDLAEILSGIGMQVLVCEKLHPGQPSTPPPEKAATVEWHVLEGPAPITPLLWHADLIIGMCTKALLEAAVLGKRAVSYQPNAKHPETVTAVRLDLADLYVDKVSFAESLPRLLKHAKTPASLVPIPCADPEAAERILSIALGNAS